MSEGAPHPNPDLPGRPAGVSPAAGPAKPALGPGPALLSVALVPIVLLAGPLLGALLVLAWVRATHRPLRTIGWVRPRRWLVTAAAGSGLGMALKLGLKIVVMPLLGAPPVNAAYHSLVGNTAALPGALATVIVVAGVGEETVWRGYLFDRLGAWWGRGTGARLATVLLTAAVFGLAHVQGQGWPGAEQAWITGLVFGAIYAATGALPFLMFAHAAFDVLAVFIIYFGWETRLAHLLFR